MHKSVLFIQSKAPFSDTNCQEDIDIIISASSYYKKVSLLLTSDGAYHLLNSSYAKELELKDFTATYNAFELYDIEPIFVEQSSLEKRKLNQINLRTNAVVITQTEIDKLINEHDVVINL